LAQAVFDSSRAACGMLSGCLESLLADAALRGDGAEAALVGGLHACAEAASVCVRSAFVEAARRGEVGAAAVASAAARCALEPHAHVDESPSTSPGSASTVFAFLAWAGAVPLLVAPWVCLWTFSSTVLGLVRFGRFKYQLMRVTVDVLLLMILYVLVEIEDFVGHAVRLAHARVRRSFREKCRLGSALRQATTFVEYEVATEALDEFRRHEHVCSCRDRRHRGDSDPSLKAGTEEEYVHCVRAALERLSNAPTSATSDEDLATLEPLLVRQAGGIDWARISRSDELLAKLSGCLLAACDARMSLDTASKAAYISWLKARQEALGKTALCLSGGGSLAMYHMGVCRFLLEEALMPQIVSGVSGGSIVAGFLAIHTDKELLSHVFVPSIVERHYPHRWFPPLWQELVNFLRIGVLVRTEDFEATAAAFFGSWTFEEAFARTGRAVSIVISSNFSQKLPACIMINHMTAPRVTIASAVATSCAAMGVMKPRGLVVKNRATGELRPFDVLGKSLQDGTFTAEVPKDYLRSFFGAAQFFVSQVNPHVSAFMGVKGSALNTLRSYIGRDLQQRARELSEYQLLPAFFGRTMCKATKHISQEFSESQAGVTMFPPDMGLGAIKEAVSNPSVRDMERYIIDGQRMAWKNAKELKARMHVEAALTRAMERIAGTQGSVPFSKSQPPEQGATVPFPGVSPPE